MQYLRNVLSHSLSTPSARRATVANLATSADTRSIFIHALREEGDCTTPRNDGFIFIFYPRPPGEDSDAATMMLDER